LNFDLSPDQLGELSAKSFGLVAVGADLCGARAAFRKHVLNEHEASDAQEEVVDFCAQQ
jgi:hypothetical protein